MRKVYLDNIRWITVVLVVIYHVIYIFKARKIFDIKTGDNLIVLGDEFQGIALIKEKGLLGLINSAKGSME